MGGTYLILLLWVSMMPFSEAFLPSFAPTGLSTGSISAPTSGISIPGSSPVPGSSIGSSVPGSTSGISSGTVPSSSPDIGGSSSMPGSLSGGVSINPRNRITTFFEDIDETFWEQNLGFFYGDYQTVTDSDEKACQIVCTTDSTCVLALVCNATDMEVTPTTPAPAPGPAFGPGGLQPISISTLMSKKPASTTKYNCITFKEVVDERSYIDTEDQESWGTNCKFLVYHPACRTLDGDAGWNPAGPARLGSGHVITRTFVCDMMNGYTQIGSQPPQITCNSEGLQTKSGGCSKGINTGPSTGTNTGLGSTGGGMPGAPMIGGVSVGSSFLSRPSLDECEAGKHDCDSNADCTDTSTSYTCECHEGFEGDGKQCTDVNECQDGSQPCDTQASCTNTDGSFDCTCNSGYEGDGQSCTDIDECDGGTHTCHSKATCNNNGGSYTCSCNTGYSGDGHTCTDIHECDKGTHTCHSKASCNNNAGGYTCSCNAGYSGDGYTCTDVNECQGGSPSCHSQASCTNTDGSFYCTCNSGYEGDGQSCTDEDECSYEPCSYDATCTNTAGSYSCECNSGFTGDGFQCEGSATEAPTGSSSGCPADFEHDSALNLCFKIILDNKVPYTDADALCKERYPGSRLAIMNSPEKIQALADYVFDNWLYVTFLWINAKQSDYRLYYHMTYFWGFYYWDYYYLEVNSWGDNSYVSKDLFLSQPHDQWQQCVEMYDYYSFQLVETNCAYNNNPVCEMVISNCPAPYEYDADAHFCFLLVTDDKTDKMTAEYKCKVKNGRLAYLSTLEKLKAVDSKMSSVGAYSGVWVGAFEYTQRLEYYNSWWYIYDYVEVNYWGDNSRVGDDLWVWLEPDSYYYESCVEFYSFWSYGLYDTGCYQQLAYVCEVPQ